MTKGQDRIGSINRSYHEDGLRWNLEFFSFHRKMISQEDDFNA